MTKPSPRTTRWLFPLLLAMAAAAFLLPGLGSLVVNREQELRVVLTARPMAEGGSWLYPEYLGEPRLRKPPLMYWVVAGAYRLAGTVTSATVARLPAAVAGALMVLAVYFLGARLGGRRRGLLSALVCLTSFIFLRQARLAETDIPLALFTTLAVGAGYRAMNGDAPWRWWLAAGFFAGVGFLIKGPAAPALPALAWLVYAVTQPRRLRRLVSPAILPALLVFAALALPWYWLILHHGRSGAEAQLSKELSATFTESHHAGPLFYYVYTLMHALAPWSLLLPFALWQAWKHRRGHARLAFVLGWFVTSFVALSAIDSKQIHYTTLLVAPASLLIGGWLGGALAPRATASSRLARRLIAILLALFTLAGLALTGYALYEPGLVDKAVLLALGIGAGLVALAAFANPCGPWCRVTALLVSLWLLHLAVSIQIVPQRKEQRVLASTLEAVRAQVAAAPHVLAAGSSQPIIEFYAGRHVLYETSASNAWRRAESGDVVVLAYREPQGPPLLEMTGTPLASGVREGLHCVVLLKR